MADLTLSKTETTLLVEAAGRGGGLEFPDRMKPSSRERMLGRLLRDSLIATGEAGHMLTPAGYGAIGMRVPRSKRPEAAPVTEAPARRPTKTALILDLLGRGEGASISELMGATGWLPHTTRAALSRLRSAGKTLAKCQREDGATAYRIVPEEPKPASRIRRVRAGEGAEAVPAG